MRLAALIRKEFLQVFRSRPMLAISFGVPIIQLIVIGFAISGDIERVPTVITDLDRSVSSRSLVSHLSSSRYLAVQTQTDGSSSGEMLQRGETIIAVTIPHGFGRDLERHTPPALVIATDAQHTNVALTGAGYVQRIVREWLLQGGLSGTDVAIATGGTTLTTRILYNPELRNSDYMVPGVMVILLTVITMMLTALAIVRERGDHNTLEQLMVTPISRLELILGKTIPFGIIGMVELSLGLGVAKLVYDIPFAGSLPLFFSLSMLFIFCTIGLGILVSTAASSQQQALFMTWFIIIFCLLMSGFFLPLDTMPRTLYLLTYLNPLRYYLTIVRELFLKGAGIADLWREAAALAGMAVVVLAAAVARFQKRIG